MTRYASIALVLLAGCAHTVLPDFRAAERAALADPGPPPADWQPDAVIHLSAGAVDDLLGGLLEEHGTLSTTLDLTLASVTPRLDVKRLRLAPSRGCDACVRVDATLDGTLAFRSVLGNGRTDLDATLVFDAVFTLDRPDQTWILAVTPARVRDLTVSIAGAGLQGAVVPLESWLTENLLAQIPPQPIARLGQGEIPLRAVRVVAAKGAAARGGAQVQILTSSPTPAPIPSRAPIKQGWRLELSQDSLLGIARAAAFRHGEVGMGIVPEPTSLAIDGAAFELGLRLWRVRGRGWWRDYTVRGRVEVTDDGVELVPGEVIEGPRSKGAVFVDPLVALAEGVILKTLSKALTTTLPASHRTRGEALPIELELARIVGSDGLLVADGTVEVGRRR